MKPLAAVATSFVAMKLIFSHSRTKKGLQTLEEVGHSVGGKTCRGFFFLPIHPPTSCRNAVRVENLPPSSG